MGASFLGPRLPMRRGLKRGLEKLLVRSGLPFAMLRLGDQRAVILAYHNVVPSDDLPRGDTSLHLPIDNFRAQLDLMESHFDLLSLADLLSGNGGSGRALAAITFDDAYRGSLEFAVPELVARGLTATVFVPPGLCGCSGFWWDILSDETLGCVPRQVREFALNRLGGRQHPILQWAEAAGLKLNVMPELYRPAEEREVLDAMGHPGISLGSHTWSHVSLSSVSDDEARQELIKPLHWLEAAESFNPVLSYPYGARAGRGDSLIQEAGYEYGLLIDGGGALASSLGDHPFSVPRLNIPRGLSREGFLAWTSGVWRR